MADTTEVAGGGAAASTTIEPGSAQPARPLQEPAALISPQRPASPPAGAQPRHVSPPRPRPRELPDTSTAVAAAEHAASTARAAGFALPASIHNSGANLPASVTAAAYGASLPPTENGAAAGGGAAASSRPPGRDHEPAQVLREPVKAPAAPRGCSPQRHKFRIAELTAQQSLSGPIGAGRAAITHSNGSTSSYASNVARNIELAHLNYDASRDEAKLRRAHSPGAASCALCGALQMPRVDIGPEATVQMLERRKTELQRELVEVDKALRNQRLKQHPSSRSAPTTPRSARAAHYQTHGSRTPAAAASPSIALPAAPGGECSSLILELRSAAESMLSGHSSPAAAELASSASIAADGSSNSYHQHRAATPTSSSHHPQHYNVSLQLQRATDERISNSIRRYSQYNHLPQYQNNSQQQAPSQRHISFHPSVSPAPRTSHIILDSNMSPLRNTTNNTHRPDLVAAPAVTTTPGGGAAAGRGGGASLLHHHHNLPVPGASPPRDEMYSNSHRDTLKELAMLRVEREMQTPRN